jgi:predicted amidohydrolase YtcJ
MFFAERSAIVRRVYGEEVFWEWLQPNMSMKNTGSILTYGADINSDPNRHPMHSLQVIVSRKNHEGTVINPAESLSREEGLLMLTRWGRYYVGRDDLGSLEPGALADLLVLSQNPLSPNVPVTKIRDTKVLFTMLNGKTAYVGPDFDY